MKIEKFEDIIAWKKAKDLTVFIYQTFKDLRDFSFRDQIQRASVSIGNNIAEGFERKSNKELKYFLSIAKGSCGEVRSMSHIALSLNYINNDKFEIIRVSSEEVSRLLAGFMRSL